MTSQAANDFLQVGVVGSGRIVERAHLVVLGEMPDVRVIGLVDSDGERAQEMARRFGIPVVCPGMDELLNLDLDVVLVACPNHLHAAMSIAALEAGAHVLCEKPMATSSAKAMAMAEAAEYSGRELMIGFTNRFRPEVVALADAIREGHLGEIVSIRCGWLRQSGIPGLGTWFTDSAQAGGGALTDLGSHMIDLALWLGGKQELLSASCVVDRKMNAQVEAAWYAPIGPLAAASGDVEVSARGFVILDGPLDVFVEVSWACAVPHDRTYIHLIGEKGSARLETVFGFSPSGHRPEYPLQIWVNGQPATQKIAGSADLLQPYRDQWRHFIDSLNAGRSLHSWLHDSLATVRVVEAMYQSANQTAADGAI